MRCDAIRVLMDERRGDQTDRLLAATRDEAVKVRLLAVRQFRRDARYSRHRKHDRRSDVEERLTEILSRESAWPVVQEALRTLETVGTLERLTVVLDGYVFTKDEHRRRRYRRTLAAVLGRDLGKDADDEAWGEAISAAREARRRAR